jgi:hypothetical protein
MGAAEEMAMSLERQVRIFAGSLVVIGTLLSWFVHSAFSVIPALIGCALVYAGITNNCFAAMMLAKLPYNSR